MVRVLTNIRLIQRRPIEINEPELVVRINISRSTLSWTGTRCNLQKCVREHNGSFAVGLEAEAALGFDK